MGFPLLSNDDGYNETHHHDRTTTSYVSIVAGDMVSLLYYRQLAREAGEGCTCTYGGGVMAYNYIVLYHTPLHSNGLIRIEVFVIVFFLSSRRR